MNFFDYMATEANITQIVLACRVPAGTGDAVHNKRPSHGLAFNTDGIKKYLFDDGTELTVRKNNIIFLPEGSNYTVTDEAIGDCYAINFKLSDDIALKPFSMNIKNASKLSDLFCSAEKVFRLKKNGYNIKCKADLYSIIYLLTSEHSAKYISEKSRHIILPAVEYIHSSYADKKISCSALAKMCGISEAYFRRIFLKCFGISPVDYINTLRLDRARELLSQTSLKIEDVSNMSGFGNVSWFCRFFVRTNGVTPSEYRKTIVRLTENAE